MSNENIEEAKEAKETKFQKFLEEIWAAANHEIKLKDASNDVSEEENNSDNALEGSWGNLIKDFSKVEIDELYKNQFLENSKDKFLTILTYWKEHRQFFLQENKQKYDDMFVFLVIQSIKNENNLDDINGKLPYLDKAEKKLIEKIDYYYSHNEIDDQLQAKLYNNPGHNINPFYNTYKSSQEKYTEITHYVAGKTDQTFFAVLLTYLSNVGAASRGFLDAHANILFPIAAILKIADWLSYTAMLYVAPNKNAGKVTTFAIKTVETVFVGLAVWGAKLLGTAAIFGSSVGAAPLIFAGIFSFSMLYNMGRFFYFGTKALIEHDKGDVVAEEFYKENAKQSLINVFMTGLGLSAVLVALVFPHIVAPIVAGLSLSAVVVTGVAVVFRGTPVGNFLQKNVVDNLEKIPVIGSIFKAMTNGLEKMMGKSPEAQEVELTNLNKISDRSVKKNYHSNTIESLKPIPSNNYDLSTEFNKLNKKINNYINSDNGLVKQISAERINNERSFALAFWPENNKRSAKKAALEILKEFMAEFKTVLTNSQKNGDKPAENINPKEITIDKQVFTYRTTDDLVDQVNKYIVDTKDGAFQSFFKDTGGVEALFKQAYKIILTADKLEDHEKTKLAGDFKRPEEEKPDVTEVNSKMNK